MALESGGEYAMAAWLQLVVSLARTWELRIAQTTPSD